jgi:alkyl sulfatase BDS1-like metallo-beta-lactamase superfamily hydrolase
MSRNHWKPVLLVGLGIVVRLFQSGRSFPPALGGGKDGGKEDPPQQVNGPKPPSEATKLANAKFAKTLPFKDTRDFALAKKGKIADLPEDGVVRNAKGEVVWDPRGYDFIKPDEKPPESVNPSLWRQAQLLAFRGLFEVVADKIYQVRGYDASNITFIEGKDGVTIVDPLISMETAKAGLDLYFKHRPKKPVVAVI